jgi:Flp pilus assembly protein CpaB
VQDVFAGRLFRTRGGAVLIGAIAAVLAAILLVAYLKSYRSSVNSGTRPMTVLVAKSLIPRGTSGTLIAQQHLYQVTSVPQSQLKALAIADPASLSGSVTAADVFPGQQLTAGDFAPAAANSIPTQITGARRAIAISVDSMHGVGGQVQTGDHVDVYVGLNGTGVVGGVIKLLASNVLVLAGPAAGGGNVILRVSAPQAPKFAFAADNGRLWLVLRPQVGATPTPQQLVNISTLVTAAAAVGG